MNYLIIIPARGGSKGIPHKNIKLLGGRPLIYYSIDVAREFTSDENICVSTDDAEIISVVEQHGLKVPFIRPAELATDTSSSDEVILHAYHFYAKKGRHYDVIILLQPTSPFRRLEFIQEAVALYDSTIDLVTSVRSAACNPYYDGFEEDANGLLHISKGEGNIVRRQDAPLVWQQNGSIYVINPKSLMGKGMGAFDRIKKYVMKDVYSIDLDTMIDWKIAELILKEKLI